MFSYIKKLQYPTNIKRSNPAAASLIISQYGGLGGKKRLYFIDSFLHFVNFCIKIIKKTEKAEKINMYNI